MGKIIVIIVVLWIICGVFSYGIALADFQKGFPSLAERDCREDKVF